MTDEIIIGGDSADIPNGTYPATLKELGDAESTAFGAFKTWEFSLENGSQVGGASSLNHGRKSKLYRWATALGVKEGEPLSSAIGKPCLVVVEEDGNGWPKVSNVLPPIILPATLTPAKGGKDKTWTSGSTSQPKAPSASEDTGVASEPTALDF